MFFLLKNILYTKFKGVGVTAGASTPKGIIEEVITVMTEERDVTSEAAGRRSNVEPENSEVSFLYLCGRICKDNSLHTGYLQSLQ